MLEGDSLRPTKNSDLGFTDDDPRENFKHAACIAQLSSQYNTIVVA
jgi:adenylylsulfate kinase-like enzyme